MTFIELIAEVKKLKCEEQRVHSEGLLEVVIAKDDMEPLHKVLLAYFGSSLKPEGQAPSGEAKRQAAPYGGIRKDQTMYFRHEGGFSECALLWPWGSGTRITVKIIQDRSSSTEGDGKGFLANLFGHK